MRHGTYLCKTSMKRMVILGINWLAFTTFVNHQTNEWRRLLFGSKVSIPSVCLLVYSIVFVFSSFVDFLVFFLFLHSNFCLYQKQTTRDKSVNFFLLLTHNPAILLLELATLISECADTKLTVCMEQDIAQNQIHSLIINKWGNGWKEFVSRSLNSLLHYLYLNKLINSNSLFLSNIITTFCSILVLFCCNIIKVQDKANS